MGVIRFSLIFLFFSCSSLRKSSELSSSNDKCDLNISFRSIGAGIDRNTHKAFNTFIAQFEIKEKVQLFYDKTIWGREGEIDYCISVKNLSKRQKKTFEKQVKRLLIESKSVYYSKETEKRKGR